jgi:hypothetical protein
LSFSLSYLLDRFVHGANSEEKRRKVLFFSAMRAGKSHKTARSRFRNLWRHWCAAGHRFPQALKQAHQ